MATEKKSIKQYSGRDGYSAFSRAKPPLDPEGSLMAPKGGHKNKTVPLKGKNITVRSGAKSSKTYITGEKVGGGATSYRRDAPSKKGKK